MTRQIVDNFNGVSLRSGESAYNSIRDAQNVDIELDIVLKKKRLRKAKGFTLVTETPLTATYSEATDTTITFDIDVDEEVGHGVIAGECIVIWVDSTLYGGAATLLSGKLFEVDSVTATTIVITVASDGDSVTGYACSLYLQLQALGQYIFDGEKMGLSSGDSINNIAHYGANKKAYDGVIYSPIGTSSYQLLCRTSYNSGVWEVIDDTVSFTTVNEAFFVKYKGNVIFVKGEKKVIDSSHGGVMYINSSDEIKLFGEENNPTAKFIETSQERLFVSYITYQGSVAISNGKAWTAVSKIYPEPIDTTAEITSTSSGTITTITCSAEHSFEIGDTVFFDGCSAIELNRQSAIVTDNDAASSLTIDVDIPTSQNGVGGTVSLRGYTWTPVYNLFDNGLTGGGLFKCDDNDDDNIVGLCSTLGALLILREYSVYLFLGTLATGEFVLGKQINTDYGGVSPSISRSSKGAWFVSQFGLSKLEGVTIQTQENKFDNIVTSPASYPIQPLIDEIADKSNLKIISFKNKVWLHDNTSRTTYVYDTVADEWVFHYGKFAQQWCEYDQEIYSLSNGMLYLHNSGYQVQSPYTMSASNISSLYPTWVMDQGAPDLMKAYDFIYFIYDGSYTLGESIIYVDVYFNGDKDNAIITIELDATINVARSWTELFTSNVWVNNLISATDTWISLATGNKSLFKKDHYYNLGKAKQIMFSFRHNDNSDFTMTRFELEYTHLGFKNVEDSK